MGKTGTLNTGYGPCQKINNRETLQLRTPLWYKYRELKERNAEKNPRHTRLTSATVGIVRVRNQLYDLYIDESRKANQQTPMFSTDRSGSGNGIRRIYFYVCIVRSTVAPSRSRRTAVKRAANGMSTLPYVGAPVKRKKKREINSAADANSDEKTFFGTLANHISK